MSLAAGKASAETTVRYWGPVAIPAPGPNQHGMGHVSEVAGLTGVVEFLLLCSARKEHRVQITIA